MFGIYFLLCFKQHKLCVQLPNVSLHVIQLDVLIHTLDYCHKKTRWKSKWQLHHDAYTCKFQCFQNKVYFFFFERIQFKQPSAEWVGVGGVFTPEGGVGRGAGTPIMSGQTLENK